MKNYYQKIQGLFAWSVILRNICLILLMGIIIIGIRVWGGDLSLDQIQGFDVIIHYLYFISVLGYLCINIRILYLQVIERTRKAQGTESKDGQSFGKILINFFVLILCILACVAIILFEGDSKVVDWIVLQNGLIVWCIVIYVGEALTEHMCSGYKNGFMHENEIRKDLFYIPKLLEKVGDDKVKDYIAHELYTYAVRARFYKYGYYICSITALVAPTIVVILNSGFSETDLTKLGVSIFSGIAAISSGMLGIVKFKESWTRYRYNCEILKTEIAVYINDSGEYEKTDKKEELFFQNINAIINGEITDWKKLRQENNS